ncbi:hypothetical protein ACIBCN_03585 [Nocardia sp. NPDC051052]|uniref:hypothetical protein n=1 Tax=Nocardia sp. NPDC051052 TaxID=3364322 RepID=UPI0037909D74
MAVLAITMVSPARHARLRGDDGGETFFDRIHDRWAGQLGVDRLARLEQDLRTVTPGEVFRFDTPNWFMG